MACASFSIQARQVWWTANTDSVQVPNPAMDAGGKATRETVTAGPKIVVANLGW
jgi:hypothetical protein